MRIAWLLLLWCLPLEAHQGWDFSVLLDGKPVGSHRFEVVTQGTARTVTSRADFTVKVLGLPLYRYRHDATEQWQGDCLRSLQSTTADGDERVSVRKEADNLPPCAMSFAYWNPRLLGASNLINPQTGDLEQVTISVLGPERIDVRGRETEAIRWRITGLPSPIDLWYAAPSGPRDPGGEWLGLESRTGGRVLRYQLQ